MKMITLGKGLCVCVLILCCSMMAYAEMMINHGAMYQQPEFRHNVVSIVADMPVIRHIKRYLQRRSLAKLHFNSEIENSMLRARLQKKVILSSV
ncbi:hypothetical protein ACFL3D_00630 [Candidatus Omnitrophota bacterium]